MSTPGASRRGKTPPFSFRGGGGRIAAKTLFLEQLSNILCDEGFFIVIALSSSAMEVKHGLSLQCCWHLNCDQIRGKGGLSAAAIWFLEQR